MATRKVSMKSLRNTHRNLFTRRVPVDPPEEDKDGNPVKERIKLDNYVSFKGWLRGQQAGVLSGALPIKIQKILKDPSK